MRPILGEADANYQQPVWKLVPSKHRLHSPLPAGSGLLPHLNYHRVSPPYELRSELVHLQSR